MNQSWKKICFVLGGGVICALLCNTSRADSIIADGGFTNPNVMGGYSYDPNSISPTPWVFSTLDPGVNGSGVAANNSGFNVMGAPTGQAGFLQLQGASISQTFTVPTSGSYDLSFSDEGRLNMGPNPFQVLLNGNVLGTYTPSTFTGFYSETPISLGHLSSTQSYTLEFLGNGGGAGNPDVTSFIDSVSIVAVPLPSALLCGTVLFTLLAGGALLKHKRLYSFDM